MPSPGSDLTFSDLTWQTLEPSVSRVERGDEMFEFPRVSRAIASTIAVAISEHRTGDDVETDVSRPPRVLMQPRQRGPNHARLLSPIDRQFGRAEASGSAGLDFDEDHECPPPRDQVNLDPVVADVSRFDAIPSPHQEGSGARFAFGTQTAARIAAWNISLPRVGLVRIDLPRVAGDGDWVSGRLP